MARRAVAEVRDEVEDVRRNVPFRLKNPRVPPGSRVTLKGNFEAEFDTGNPDDAKRGWLVEHDMVLRGDTYEAQIPNLQVGRSYNYVYYIEPPSGSSFYIKDERDSNKDRTITIDPEPERSPSSTLPLAQVKARVRTNFRRLLESAQTTETMNELEAVCDDVQADIDAAGITVDVTSILLEVAPDEINAMPTIPTAIKEQFPKGTAIANLNSLMTQWQRGRDRYRRKVFEGLRSNPAAKRLFGLEGQRARYNAASPLGTPELDEMFNRLCAEKDLAHFITAGAEFETTIRGAFDVPARSPALFARRRALLTTAASRLTPQQRSLLAQVPNDTAGQLLHTAVQGGVILAAGWSAIPILGLAGVAEAGLGVGLQDIVAALRKNPRGQRDVKGLFDKMKSSNFFTRVLLRTKKGERGEALKKVAKEALARSLPASAFWYEPKFRPAPLGAPPAATPQASIEEGNPEELIRAACDQAVS